jgi:hypothetical protein
LNAVEKTARKGVINSVSLFSNTVSINANGSGPVSFSRTEGGGGGTGGYTITSAGGQVTSTNGDGVNLLKQALDNVKREDLGTQTTEGVEATGTRTTTTIAAGEIGNERPIEIVTERWYSNALQTTVMSRR